MNEVWRVLKPGGYALIWLHSFEEPFLYPEEMKKLAESTMFGHGDIRFVGALCCLVLKKRQV